MLGGPSLEPYQTRFMYRGRPGESDRFGDTPREVMTARYTAVEPDDKPLTYADYELSDGTRGVYESPVLLNNNQIVGELERQRGAGRLAKLRACRYTKSRSRTMPRHCRRACRCRPSTQRN